MSIKLIVKKVLKWVQTTISTVMTWVTFILLPVSLVFSVYHLYWSFDLHRVIGGLLMLVVCVYVNKAL